jgi:hypothetical protein
VAAAQGMKTLEAEAEAEFSLGLAAEEAGIGIRV